MFAIPHTCIPIHRFRARYTYTCKHTCTKTCIWLLIDDDDDGGDGEGEFDAAYSN